MLWILQGLAWFSTIMSAAQELTDRWTGGDEENKTTQKQKEPMQSNSCLNTYNKECTKVCKSQQVCCCQYINAYNSDSSHI